MANGTTTHSKKPTVHKLDQIITRRDLLQFKTELFQELKELFKTDAIAESPKWIKTYQVRKMLGISTSTLQVLRLSGTLTCSKIGGTLFYNVNEINALLEGANKPSAQKPVHYHTFGYSPSLLAKQQTIPKLEDVRIYFLERKRSEAEATEFFTQMEAKQWKDRNGRSIPFWKNTAYQWIFRLVKKKTGPPASARSTRSTANIHTKQPTS